MNFLLSEPHYKLGKWIATILLPALATFYAGLGALWGWGNISPVVGSITLVDTLLGSLLMLSTTTFNKQLTTVAAVPTETVQEVGKVVEGVVDGVTGSVVDVLGGEKNTSYDADAPPSHRKEN
jgi:hypothetical protein